jgi:hypothetical protein
MFSINVSPWIIVLIQKIIVAQLVKESSWYLWKPTVRYRIFPGLWDILPHPNTHATFSLDAYVRLFQMCLPQVSQLIIFIYFHLSHDKILFAAKLLWFLLLSGWHDCNNCLNDMSWLFCSLFVFALFLCSCSLFHCWLSIQNYLNFDICNLIWFCFTY